MVGSVVTMVDDSPRSGKVTFSIDGKGVLKIARQMYHEEQKIERALNIIKSGFGGITPEQITAVLNGDAWIDSECYYHDEPDAEYKLHLTEIVNYRTRNCTEIAERWVENRDHAQYVVGFFVFENANPEDVAPITRNIRDKFTLHRWEKI